MPLLVYDARRSASPCFKAARREYLGRIWCWNEDDLERKLEAYQAFHNQHRCHTGLRGVTPARQHGALAPPFAQLQSYRWQRHCGGLFQTPSAV